jgi:hypothetical protein
VHEVGLPPRVLSMKLKMLLLGVSCGFLLSACGGPMEEQASALEELGTAESAVTTCGSGYVCIYQGDIWDGGTYHPMVARYYNYGTYNLSNMIGEYTVKNCQTGGAGVAAYSGYNATGSLLWDLRVNNCSSGLWTNLTPVYSLRLHP